MDRNFENELTNNKKEANKSLKKLLVVLLVIVVIVCIGATLIYMLFTNMRPVARNGNAEITNQFSMWEDGTETEIHVRTYVNDDGTGKIIAYYHIDKATLSGIQLSFDEKMKFESIDCVYPSGIPASYEEFFVSVIENEKRQNGYCGDTDIYIAYNYDRYDSNHGEDGAIVIEFKLAKEVYADDVFSYQVHAGADSYECELGLK